MHVDAPTPAPATHCDAIVIGSGIGGMTAAGLLAGVSNRRVLVLERHTEPGGLTHAFGRDGARWDVGLHYVGQMGPGSPMRAYFDYLSGGRMRWRPMPAEFERFVYPGIDLRVPSDARDYERRLCAAWPDEARAIRRYFSDVRWVARWAALGFARGMVPRAVEPLLRLLQRCTGQRATQTTRAYLQARFRSPQLRAVLASQWADYGLPPAHSAFAIHALIVTHYLQGAWYPEGGAGRIARTFEHGIERAGGEIRVAQEVTRVLVEGGAAVGVEAVDHRGPVARSVTYRAPVVISDAGVPVTFGRLLPSDGPIGAATLALRTLALKLATGASAVTLYLRLSGDVRAIGVQGENHWLNTGFDHDDLPGQTRGVMAGEPRSIYVSFPSAKDAATRFHTAEIIAFVDAAAFAAWRDRRDEAGYTALKQRIGDGLLRLADAHIPGLANLVRYSELSTPLTVERYSAHPAGRFYGLAATPERYRARSLGPRTPVANLYLAGADAGSLGIVGAMMGGVAAACQVLGASGIPMIRAAIQAGPAAAGDVAGPRGSKRVAVLSAKQRLTATIWRITVQVQGDVDPIGPGQFARLRVGEDEWRDYSIAAHEGQTVHFLISTRTQGQGSQFVQQADIGTATLIELPLGRFTLLASPNRRVFVATGTGIAPLLPMMRALTDAGQCGDATLVFGCRVAGDDITLGLRPLPPTVIRCYSRGQAPAGGLHGRVTDALGVMPFDPARTDFYVCGSAAMVADGRRLLQRRGARNVFVETY